MAGRPPGRIGDPMNPIVHPEVAATKHFLWKEFLRGHKLPEGLIPEARVTLRKLQAARDLVDRPLVITSGYRPPDHPREALKTKPGYHTRAMAVDVRVMDGHEAGTLVKAALQVGLWGIGIRRKTGERGIVHLDSRICIAPVMWSY